MRDIKIIRVIYLAFILMCISGVSVVPNEEMNTTGIAARVNDEAITWDEVLAEVPHVTQGKEEAYHRTLRRMVEDRVFIQEAKRFALTVSEAEVDEIIEKRVKALGSLDKLLEYLRFRRTTLSKFRDKERERLLIQKIIVLKYRQLQNILLINYISPEEMQKYYLKNKSKFKRVDEVSILLISLPFTDAHSREESLRHAESIQRHLKEGSNFHVLAFYHNSIPELRQPITGITRDQDMISETFKNLIFDKMKPQEISDIIEEDGAFHLVKIMERIDNPEISYENAQEIMKMELQANKWIENKKRLRTEILKKTYYWPETLFD